MQNIMNAFPSKYLKASDFEQPALLTMTSVKVEEVASGEHKPILFFSEKDKGMVLNKTNAKTLAKLYGVDPSKWNGKQIVAFLAMVDFKGDTVESIRLRKPKPNKESENLPDSFDDEVPF